MFPIPISFDLIDLRAVNAWRSFENVEDFSVGSILGTSEILFVLYPLRSLIFIGRTRGIFGDEKRKKEKEGKEGKKKSFPSSVVKFLSRAVYVRRYIRLSPTYLLPFH